jgi:multicomponent Na+:H+ antiporter subunit E
MLAFIITTILSFIVYLLLTTGSGTEVLGLWSYAELLLGAILSVIVGFIARTLFVKNSYRMLNPVRWILFLIYGIGPFFYGMAKANVDVAYRVITGKINPGIVKISPKLKTDLGITLLANSITLTPGTLSVDIDENTNDLYIHWINVKTHAINKKPIDAKYVCGSFDKWVRRIAE